MRIALYCAIALCAAALTLAPSSPASAITTDKATNDARVFIEWAFGFQLDPATVQSIHDGMASDLASDPAGTQATIKDMNNVMAWVNSHSVQQRALARSLIEPRLVAAWQGDTSSTAASAKAIVAAWEQHNVIIANGTPPLRHKIAADYIAMYEFIAKEAGKPIPPALANHAQFYKQVAAQYSAASPAMQMQFNQVQTLWYAVQIMWKNATPAQRAAIRQQWRGGSSTSNAVAAGQPPAQAGFTGQTSSIGNYKEHLFVSSQAQVMMSNWTPVILH
jgi:hypothetical protein